MNDLINYKIGDKEYKVHPLTQEIKSAFQKYVESQELSLIQSQRDVINDDDYKELFLHHLFLVKHDQYEFDSDRSWKYLKQPKHFIKLMTWCFNENGLLDQEVEQLVENNTESFRELWTILEQQKKN